MPAHKLRVGIQLPTRDIVFHAQGRPRDASLVFAMAEAAGEMGCDSLWVGDSLTSKPRLEPLTILGAVGSRVPQVRLGTNVLLAALRHPLLLAHTAATLDVLTGGRLVLGVDLGGTVSDALRKEWEHVGISPRQRLGRLEESLLVMRKLWAESDVSFHGKHFSLEDATLDLRPVQQPGIPIILTCHYHSQVEAQFRRAARFGDGFVSIADTPEEFSELCHIVRRYAQEEDRDGTSMEPIFSMTVNLGVDEEAATREADAFLMAYYGPNIAEFRRRRWGPYGRPERSIDRIRQYYQAGAHTVIVRFASFDPLAQLKLFAHEVWPALQDGAC